MTETLWKTVMPLWKRGRFFSEGLHDDQGKPNAYSFIKFLRYEFSEEYERAFTRYKLSARDGDVPMAGTARVVHLGNTSSSVRAELRNALTGTHYGTIEKVYVHVSPVTRRPFPYPEHIRRKYDSSIDVQEPVRVVKVDHIPGPADSDSIWTEVTIQPDMIDIYKHTNVKV